MIERKCQTIVWSLDCFLDRMASQKQLRVGVIFVDRMPRTIFGKFDRHYFKNMAKDELLTEIC